MDIIRTIQWTAESPGIFSLCANVSKLGAATIAHPKNFVEFIASYENCSYKDLVNFAKRWIMSDRFKNSNVTSFATLSEDRCLFSTHGTHKEALDIIVRYLDILNAQQENPHPWAYLDQEEKAIVHFVDRQGYYAELYCQSKEEFSVLHLLEHHGQKLFIPVVFMVELPGNVLKNTMLTGQYHLQDYLPREKFDCLSKGGRKSTSWYDGTGNAHGSFTHDSGDGL